MAREASDNFFNIWGDNGGGICFNFSTSVTLPMGGSSDAEKKCYLRKLGDW
ncbi:hypothetical protein KJ830_10135 [bacterium]|nr:hypothetical protein [bacterium]